MNKLISTLAGLALASALCASQPALAGTTQIAQVPLLNITGTGTVKPNLMLLFDNSGSMDQTYTPDYVNDNLCRSAATLQAGITACAVGHPPFMSPDFNKQYYNPTIRYLVPIKSDGSYYPEQNAANTSNWTSVSGDGFGAHKADMAGNTVTANINLVTGFPDLKWCSGSSCQFNTASYTYPDATYQTATAITTGPYYYTIGVGQFCTDESMKTCVSTAVGATAPSGYPVAAKVRWCSDKLLTQCQGKRVGSFIYPGYSKPAGATASYGTIAIGASATASSLGITSVVVNGSTTVTNATVTAATGTNSLIKQQTLASALAANIMATTNAKAASSTSLYFACVKTPTGQPTVSACSVFGITLSADNLVAVLPVSCSGSISVATCVTFADNSRAGWGIAVTAPTVAVTAYAPARAVISFTGSGTSGSQTAILKNLSYAGTALVGSTSGGTPSYLSLGKGWTPTQIASALVSKIGTTGNIKAYLGNSSNCPTGYTVTSVCLQNWASTDNTGTIPAFSMDNQGSISWSTTGSSGYVAAVNDAIPTTTTALTAGSGAPNPFVRVNIVSGQTYPKGIDRTDCAGSTCTYAEEMNNFANWYVYYKSRLQMMKTSVGIAFSAITANYKVGYVKLSNAGAGAAIDLKPADFTGSARASWYTTLYNTTTSGSTPIRTAMDNVGRMFGNLLPYNYAAGQEVVQYPCQQNFMILTTDGYWNGSSTANVVNNDNVESAARFCTQARGCLDARAQSQPSIADVALHWYNGGSSTGTVSLRPALEPDMSKPGSVPAAGGENTHLHMNTYTLGLGVDGVMTYEANYDTAPKTSGDFYNLITAATSGCPWNGGGAYVWPDPDVTNAASTVQERVDDLWHAAINGHGKYFSAQDPKDVVGGLSEALSNMQVHVGAAAAAATSTPNITLTDNDIFSDTFTTVKWYGELSDKKIDSTDGSVGNTATWTTSDTLGKKVGNSSDSRTIYMYNIGGAVASTPDPFLFGNMKGAAGSWFSNKCTSLSQCVLLSASDKVIVNDGASMVNYLRGQQQYADDSLFRAYTLTLNTPAGAAGPIPIVLGDIASSKPAFVRDPRNDYPDPDYVTFKDKYGNPTSPDYRSGVVFTAANDGMLHAFDSATGNELWAYVPRITMKKLYALASTTYGTNHQFTTDGSPEVADVKAAVGWRTVLVAGLNGGGRGYYALDITDTSHPKQLWEFCADSTVCPLSDGDLGLTFGNPQFGTLANGRWVVFLTSGYNNVPGTDGVGTGTGKGFLYVLDAYTGELISKNGNGSGDTTTPSGLAKISAISDDPGADPRVQYVYGGDNQGQMWRFDLTAASGAINVSLLGNAGVNKPITTRPDVTMCAVQVTTTTAGVTTTTTTGKRVVLFGTGRLLDVPDTSDTSVQSLYLLKDSASPITDIRGSTMVKQTLSLLGSSSNINSYQITNNPVDLTSRDGWYFDWSVNAGERMNLDPQIVSGVANVVTNMPSSSSACSVGGSSNLYQVNVCNGQAIGNHPVGATLSNTSAAVGFIIIRLPNGQLKMITTLADGTNKTSPLSEQISADAHRTGWRRVKGE
ncbi:PilC/PilY family type IV pilus protein [Duganella sp. S19_KUP01_CR8]|uniref:PilC/PilY family type IV pilus protein n=1 Tax=Duganella sp. S19_KUP01_CR8 TaxID=3025502 RepID=UPI002FCDB3AB